MAKGGYRKPSNPAPVSGPGRLARRTDGGPAEQNVVRLPNAGYGESAEFERLQSGAAMSAAAPTPTAGPATPATAGGPGGGMDLAALFGGGGGSVQPPTPLSAGTERPLEPLTAGAPIGEGPGPSPEVMTPRAGRVSETFERLLGNDLTGEIADMYADLRRRGL